MVPRDESSVLRALLEAPLIRFPSVFLTTYGRRKFARGPICLMQGLPASPVSLTMVRVFTASKQTKRTPIFILLYGNASTPLTREATPFVQHAVSNLHPRSSRRSRASNTPPLRLPKSVLTGSQPISYGQLQPLIDLHCYILTSAHAGETAASATAILGEC